MQWKDGRGREGGEWNKEMGGAMKTKWGKREIDKNGLTTTQHYSNP